MDSIEVLGGNALYGEIEIQGSKNSALPIIAGAILNKGLTVLHHCPKIYDVFYMAAILESIGCVIKWEGHTLIIDAADAEGHIVPSSFAEKMRSSVILLGSLIGRNKQACISYPGGCVIGERPIDLHLEALRKMNISITETLDYLCAESDKTTGTEIDLKFPSVGATENILLAAVLADGKTIIRNAACEPEIVELCQFLKKMGARIEGAGNAQICIEGVEKLHDVEYTIVSDRIVAGTYLLAAMGTRGKIRILNAPENQLDSLLTHLHKMGGYTAWCGKTLFIDGTRGNLSVDEIITGPFPEFPTDLQSQIMAVLTISNGCSRITESIFEDRFKIVSELNKMGADIFTEGRMAVVQGVPKLKGAVVSSEELRGGAALLIAGLMAEGSTVVKNRHFIERGYEDITGDLRTLGGQLKNL